MTSESVLTVTGIDGGTPLGFLAGLGLLHVLRDAAGSESVNWRLSWRLVDAWRPVLEGGITQEQLAQVVVDDAARWADAPLLKFRYVKLEKKGPKPVGGLKAPLPVVRAWSRARRDAGDEQSAAYGEALFCSDVTESSEKSAGAEEHRAAGIAVDGESPDMDLAVERTFLDFTARNAQFLEQVEYIRGHLNDELVQAALSHGALDYDAPRTLDWDPGADTPGAIYTGFRRGYLPVHEWLGFRALRLFPMAGRGSKVRMTACTGRRLEGDFIWPLWERPATLEAVASLVGHPGLSRLNPLERRALGIAEVFAAGLTKKADGYSGTFAPARPL